MSLLGKLQLSKAWSFYLCFLGFLGFLWFGFLLWDVILCPPPERFARSIQEGGHHFQNFFFFIWFREGGPVENLQWFFLGLSAVLYGYLAGIFRDERGKHLFFLLLALAFVFLLIEDAGNPRHRIKHQLRVWLDTGGQNTPLITLFKFGYFAALAALPTWVLVFYRREIQKFPWATFFFFAGYGFYGLAGFLSFIGNAFSSHLDPVIYERMGLFIWDLLAPLGNENHQTVMEGFLQHDRFGTRITLDLMDTLFEESIEALGAAAFLACGIACLESLRRQQRGGTKRTTDSTV